MAGGRRTVSPSPPRSNHADIPTPSWRPFSIHCASSQDDELRLSDDDMSDEAYIKRHQPLAEDERRRWAGVSAVAHTPNGSRRPSKSKGTKPDAPIFPLPAECYFMFQRAMNKYCAQQKRSPQSNFSQQAKSRVRSKALGLLPILIDTESALQKQRRALEDRVRKRGKKESSFHSHGHPLTLYPRSSLNESAHLFPPRNISVPGAVHSPFRRSLYPDVAPPPHANGGDRKSNISLQIPADDPDAYFESMEDGMLSIVSELLSNFRCKAQHLLPQLNDAVRKARIDIPPAASFSALHHDLNLAGSVCERMSSQRGHVRVEEIFRKEIDKEKFPLFQKHFRLHPEYRIDGTDRSLEEIANERGSEMKYNGGHPSAQELDSFSQQQRAAITPNAPTNEWSQAKVGAIRRSDDQIRPVPNGHPPPSDVYLRGRINKPPIREPPIPTTRRLHARRKLRENVKRKLPQMTPETPSSSLLLPLWNNSDSNGSDVSDPSHSSTPPGIGHADYDIPKSNGSSTPLRFHKADDEDDQKYQGDQRDQPMVVDLDADD